LPRPDNQFVPLLEREGALSNCSIRSSARGKYGFDYCRE
jgi:hypothetical protein